MKRGVLIVIEGVDRCGKTSQTLKLVESLKQRNILAERVSFPDRATNTGEIISTYLSDNNCKLNDQAIHLLFSANRWESVEKMKQQLQQGVTLIVDRYSYSGIAFSSAKGLDMNWCIQPELGLPKPDLVILLNIQPAVQSARVGFGNERYETSAFQCKVSSIFQNFANKLPNWRIVDGNQCFDNVHSDLLRLIMLKIKNVEDTNAPLDYLNIEDTKNFMNSINGSTINDFK